ncbi:MAG: hypothetical protein V3U76_08705 [Granulosicoccus sp.]
MFETHDASKLLVPPGIYPHGVSHWSTVYLSLVTPWLLVTVSVRGPAQAPGVRVVMMTQAQHLIELQETTDSKVENIQLVRPRPAPSKGWDMGDVVRICTGIRVEYIEAKIVQRAVEQYTLLDNTIFTYVDWRLTDDSTTVLQEVYTAP